MERIKTIKILYVVFLTNFPRWMAACALFKTYLWPALPVKVSDFINTAAVTSIMERMEAITVLYVFFF